MARPAGFEPATMGYLLEAYPKTHALSRLSHGRTRNTETRQLEKVFLQGMPGARIVNTRGGPPISKKPSLLYIDKTVNFKSIVNDEHMGTYVTGDKKPSQ